jgi:polyisoprenoid-binding protein YceI
MEMGTQRGLRTLRYIFDKTASKFTVQAFATGMLSVLGHNPTIAIRDYDGDVQFVPGSYDQALLHFTLRTGTLEVLDEMKRDDREKLENAMYGEVLEVSRFPDATFDGKRISVKEISANLLQAEVTGDLNLHGATQRLSFLARVTTLGTMLRISGEFSIRQSDYGIKPVSFAGGALRLKDDLKFTFEMVARLEE